jgi:serine/threonine protein kinase
MHCFKIIHADIKPENVAFSPKLGKAVFLDFGLSMIIKEKLGLKTNISFRGSPKYCCPEMLDLLSSSRLTNFIDLYYNDFYGLK